MTSMARQNDELLGIQFDDELLVDVGSKFSAVRESFEHGGKLLRVHFYPAREPT